MAEEIESAAPPDGPDARRLVALILDDGREPPPDRSERAAIGTWSAVTALWHPALLARVDALPRIEGAEGPTPPEPSEVCVVAEGAAVALPSGYRTQADDAGLHVLDGQDDRLGLALRVLEILEPGAIIGHDPDDTLVVDFFALGAARFWLRHLTIAMGHADSLDLESLTREALAGARAWQVGDVPTATNRLRAAFEVLTQARERFYPVDAYLVDLLLLDPTSPPGSLDDALAARSPFTILAPARAIDRLAVANPESIAAVREAITEGWADVAGGTFDEADEALLPLESIRWQFQYGGEVYRRHLDDRNVETLATRRFALYPQRPQLARRFGFRFALHLALDAGRFPVPAESKRLWEAPDGSQLESLMRPPLAADVALSGLQLPWRLARTMKDDHVATLPLVHWPEPLAPWYRDLRRVAGYSPVLARHLTLNDYFHQTDRPYEAHRPDLDAYVTPYLADAVARDRPDPISDRVHHAGLRARLDSLRWLDATARLLSDDGPDTIADLSAAEDALESGRLAEAEAAIVDLEPKGARAVASIVAGTAAGDRPGTLVLNPLNVPRRVAVRLPEAEATLRPEGPLRAAQLTEDGVWGVVELPPHGFAWVPCASDTDAGPMATGAVSVRDRTLRNESLAVEIDPATGGIRSLRGASEPTARLGQQLVMTGLDGPDGPAGSSRMEAGPFEFSYGGPALAEAISHGRLLDPADGRPLAHFRQRFRLWADRPYLELDIEIHDLDPAWLARAAGADPWAHHLACRWAWPDPNTMIRRSSLLASWLTEADRPETPEALDLSTRRQRTALLFGGLAHHRRHGNRMLDTLLIAGRESARHFRLGLVLDSEVPAHAAQDFFNPAPLWPMPGPPRIGPAGWFYHLDNRAVVVTSLAHAENPDDGQGRRLTFHLLETTGHPARCRLRFVRNPNLARQVDLQGERVVDLAIVDDAVLIDLTPNEFMCLDVLF